jgi:hypothetical protein
MTEQHYSLSQIEDDCRQFFAELLASLPEEAATLEERLGTFPEGIDLTLLPSRPGAARLSLDAQQNDGIVNLRAGLGTVLEVEFKERTYRGVESLREVFEVACKAVIEGHLQEVAWFRGGELVRCKSTIVEGGTKRRWYYTTSRASLLRLGEVKRQVRYVSYL